MFVNETEKTLTGIHYMIHYSFLSLGVLGESENLPNHNATPWSIPLLSSAFKMHFQVAVYQHVGVDAVNIVYHTRTT